MGNSNNKAEAVNNNKASEAVNNNSNNKERYLPFGSIVRQKVVSEL